jgi:hypothetical protein
VEVVVEGNCVIIRIVLQQLDTLHSNKDLLVVEVPPFLHVPSLFYRIYSVESLS